MAATDVPEIVETAGRSVFCDGGGGALGHPGVYLNMGDDSFVECPYCGRRFVLVPDAEPADDPPGT